MKQLEYVRIMSDEEVMKNNLYHRNLQESKERASKNLLENNKDLLVNAYHEYESNAIRYKEDQLQILNDEVKLWNDKICICGKPMRFVSSHGFWGCPDYKNDKKEHITFRFNHDDYLHNQKERLEVEVCKDWATSIIRNNGLREKIKAKQLLLFYKNEGLEDLREKYGNDNTIKSISSYVYAKEKSDKEEQEIKEFFEKHFNTVVSQMNVKYKLKGEKEKLCKIDLLISDEQDVFLIEVKRNTMSVDDEQLSLYYNLIKRIMDDVNDTRTLTPLFIVSNEDGYDDPNDYFFFENFDDVTDTIELKRIMRMFNHLKVKQLDD